jgi:hypothetical protein
MRGCLFVVIVGAAVLAVGGWLLSPAIAAAIVTGSLRATGFTAESQTLTVAADPPVRLLTGRADRLTLDATGVTWHALRASRLGFTLDDVDLLDRTAVTVDGRFDGVAVDAGQGAAATTATATITFDGPADAAFTTIEVDRPSVRALVTEAVSRSFSTQLTDVELITPDRLRLVAPGASLEGTLTVSASNQLSLSTRLGSVPLVTIEPSLPLDLRSVSADPTTLRITGVLDVGRLLQGAGSG